MMSEAWGFVAVVAACIAYGSQFVLLKGIEIGDGMTYQWIYSTGVMMVGLILNAVGGFAQFYPMAMLAGVLWASGFVVTVPMFHFLGIAPSFLIWTSIQMVVGWASGRFGWFGIPPEVPASLTLNYLGLGLSVFGGLFFFFIKNSRLEGGDDTSIMPTDSMDNERLDYGAIGSQEEPETVIEENLTKAKNPSVEEFMPWMPKHMRYTVGILCTCWAGFMYGVMFAPVSYIQSRALNSSSVYYGASQDGLPYAFAFCSGVFAMNSLFLVIYATYKLIRRRELFLSQELVVRTVPSGWMWGFATACWLYANSQLTVAITYPMLTRLPGTVQTIYGIFYLREIRGVRNYVIVTLGTVIVAIGSIFTGMSHSFEFEL